MEAYWFDLPFARSVRVSDGEVNQVRHYTSLATGPTDPDGYPWKREYLITAQTDTSDSWSTAINKRKELHLFASFLEHNK